MLTGNPTATNAAKPHGRIGSAAKAGLSASTKARLTTARAQNQAPAIHGTSQS